ncbi:uncharacterized protein PFL1_03676 [Pseudozyma flocculosa PF-1]|uniref:mRNA 3'-end-processing protein RNA14 n=1 Tax=Pseudozyma flocculosa PF-1 TaxID=1277687 RepID=A0A061H8S5_9BASI|nr:uncharacterized protein PFL1_03676 [Pseudozyma flocculosa PF-1]EPQ28874.1 hypothetical protein PFL1_03676 [Pseudozyma flocculosa PF-1]
MRGTMREEVEQEPDTYVAPEQQPAPAAEPAAEADAASAPAAEIAESEEKTAETDQAAPDAPQAPDESGANPDAPVHADGDAAAAAGGGETNSGQADAEVDAEVDADADADGEAEMDVGGDDGAPEPAQEAPASLPDSTAAATSTAPAATVDASGDATMATTTTTTATEDQQAQETRQELATEVPASMAPQPPSATATSNPTSTPGSEASVLGKRPTPSSTATAPTTTSTATPPAPTRATAMAIPTAPAAMRSSQSQTQTQMTAGDRKKMLEERVRNEPRDGEAWLALIEEAQNREDMDDTRRLYDGFFKTFPSQGRQWIAYADLELAHSNFAQVEAIFTRCLRSTPSVDLWKFYLSYTRRVNPLPPPSGADEDGPREQARRVLEGAYEFALKHTGMDKDSGPIWMDYISLIKEREARGGWKEGQKMDDLRRVYQRAVSVPVANVEAIWKDYDAYENGLNKLTAKKFLAERSPAYMTARRVLRELKARSDNLARPLLPRIPVWTTAPVSGDAAGGGAAWEKERAQVEAWKQYLKWEESNPLLLEDLAAHQARVLSAYRKATMFMRFYPEIWYMASLFLSSVDRQDEAAEWLKEGIEACPGSFLLPFAYVELCEIRKTTADCGAVFDALLEHIHAKIDARKSQLEQTLRAIDTEAELERAQAAAKRVDEGDGDVDIDGEQRELERKVDEQRQAKKAQCEEASRPEIEGLKEAAALVWIKYMHFHRRTGGIRPTRTVFGRARKSPHCTWQVFEASALMEYHCSKDAGVATKVFELALKTFGQDEAFVARYLDFLISINDDSNARALFERTIGTFPPERARPIWDRWADYEYSFGDTAAIQRLESRLSEVYPDEPKVKRFVDRNSYMDLDMIGPRDLGFQASVAGASAAEPSGWRTVPPPREGPGSIPSGGGPGGAGKGFGGGPAPPTGPSGRFGGNNGPPPPPPPQGPRDVFAELPEAVLFFMDILPNAKSFDGPTFKPDDLMECLRHANVPMAQPNFGPPGGRFGGPGPGGFGGGGGGGFGRRGGRGGRMGRR